MAKQGLIYCVRNPLFPYLVKIGKTAKNNVEERGLDRDLPEKFITIWKHKVNDIDAAELKIHDACKLYSYKSKSGASTEYYYDCVVEQAEKCVKLYAMPNDDEFEEPQKNGRRTPRTFAAANIPIGSKLHFNANKNNEHKNEGKIVEVASDKNQVILDGKKMAISSAAKKLFGGGKKAVNGFNHFKYNGKLITDII